MSAGRLLLVAGSRSLGENARAYLWAVAELRAALDASRGAWVLTGGAPGPDVWAEALALARGLRVIVYRPDGTRRDSDGPPARWGEPGTRRDAPLLRNAAMVERAVRAQFQGWTVSVLGLVDPASPTHGTDHTLRLAIDAGLPVQRQVWGRLSPEGAVPA